MFLSRVYFAAQYTVSISVFAYIVLWMPAKLLVNYPPSHAGVLLSGILPHVPISWLWQEVAAFEQYSECFALRGKRSWHRMLCRSK